MIQERRWEEREKHKLIVGNRLLRGRNSDEAKVGTEYGNLFLKMLSVRGLEA
jgi:hypothetical protein